jgi:hypothetical protein
MRWLRSRANSQSRKTSGTAKRIAGGHGRDEAQRRQGRVHRPHQADDAHLELEVRHHPGKAHAHHRTAQVDDAPGGERAREQRQLREPDPRGSGQQEDDRGADGMPGVGHGGQDPARRDPAQGTFGDVAADQPDGHRDRHHAGRQHEQHGHEDELRRHHEPGADGELDPAHQRVDAD